MDSRSDGDVHFVTARHMGAKRMIKCILVPTDGSAHAKKAVLLASDIAEKYGARLVLLHVALQGATADEMNRLVDVKKLPKSAREIVSRFARIQRAAMSMPESVGVSIPVPDEVLDAVADLILDDAERVAKKAGVKRVKRLVKHGRAARCILAAEKDEKANLIVMGSRGLGNLEGMLMGSVSHKVSSLSRSTCVTVK